MTDKQEHNPIDPGLFDTQQLLRGVDPPPEGSFRLEDILAEYASDSPQPAAPAPEAPPESVPESVPEERPPVPSGEGAAPLPPPDGDFWDGLFAVAEEEEPSPDDPTREFPPGKKRPPKESKAKSQKRPPAKREPPPEPAPKPEPVPKEEPPRRQEPPTPQPAGRREAPAEPSPSGTEAASSAPQPELPPEEAEEDAPLSMEDIVANTVDAVKEQQAKRQAQFLKQLEKIRKKASRAAPKSRPVE